MECGNSSGITGEEIRENRSLMCVGSQSSCLFDIFYLGYPDMFLSSRLVSSLLSISPAPPSGPSQGGRVKLKNYPNP